MNDKKFESFVKQMNYRYDFNMRQGIAGMCDNIKHNAMSGAPYRDLAADLEIVFEAVKSMEESEQ